MFATTHTIEISLPEAAVGTAGMYEVGVGQAKGATQRRTASAAPSAATAAEYIARADTSSTHVAVPAWPFLLAANIERLHQLAPGWDGPGSCAISRTALYTARRITRRALAGVNDATAPRLVPGGDGSVQIEWHEKHGELELDIAQDGSLSIWGRDHRNGSEFDGEGSTALALFERWAPRLAANPSYADDVQVTQEYPLFPIAA